MQLAKSIHEVVNCNKLNKVLSVPSYSYTAPTTLGIRQEVEQIMDNVFYSTFLNVFKKKFTTFLRFLTFVIFF